MNIEPTVPVERAPHEIFRELQEEIENEQDAARLRTMVLEINRLLDVIEQQLTTLEVIAKS